MFNFIMYIIKSTISIYLDQLFNDDRVINCYSYNMIAEVVYKIQCFIETKRFCSFYSQKYLEMIQYSIIKITITNCTVY